MKLKGTLIDLIDLDRASVPSSQYSTREISVLSSDKEQKEATARRKIGTVCERKSEIDVTDKVLASKHSFSHEFDSGISSTQFEDSTGQCEINCFKQIHVGCLAKNTKTARIPRCRRE